MSEWEQYAEEQAAKKPRVGDNARAVIEDQVNALWDAEKEVERLEEELKRAKELVRNISEDQIPKTLEDMGLEEVTIKGGLKVKVKNAMQVSPKKENRERVYDWLEEHGHGGLVKRHGIFTVGRDNEKQAKAWIKSIKKFPGKFERKVEPAALKSFVTKEIAAGTEIPMDLFGVFSKRVAEVKSED